MRLCCRRVLAISWRSDPGAATGPTAVGTGRRPDASPLDPPHPDHAEDAARDASLERQGALLIPPPPDSLPPVDRRIVGIAFEAADPVLGERVARLWGGGYGMLRTSESRWLLVLPEEAVADRTTGPRARGPRPAVTTRAGR